MKLSMFSERIFEKGSCSYYGMNMLIDSTYDMVMDGLSCFEDDFKTCDKVRVSNIRELVSILFLQYHHLRQSSQDR